MRERMGLADRSSGGGDGFWAVGGGGASSARDRSAGRSVRETARAAARSFSMRMVALSRVRYGHEDTADRGPPACALRHDRLAGSPPLAPPDSGSPFPSSRTLPSERIEYRAMLFSFRESDAAIVRRTVEGHPESFEPLVFRYQKKAFAIAH